MASQVTICNLALTEMGHGELISSITDQTKVAILLNQFYEVVRDEMLSGFPWGFAMARAQLTQDPTAPAYEWSYAYNLPTGLVRIWEVYDGSLTVPVEYIREGAQLLTNETTVYLRYIKQITDPQKFDPLFVRPFALKLALTIQPGIKKDIQREQMLQAAFDESIQKAYEMNAFESRESREKRLGIETDSGSWEGQGRS